jgi:hypothetical protein
MTPDALQRIHARRLDAAYDAAGIDAYQHPSEIMEPATEAALVRQFAELMTPIFGYIAKGRLTGTIDMRGWVVLYCTRLDMIHGETIAQFAARRGVNPSRIQRLINEFRDAVPGMRGPHQKSNAQVERMRVAHRREIQGEAQQIEIGKSCPPPGKESFYNSASEPGSALRLASPREG